MAVIIPNNVYLKQNKETNIPNNEVYVPTLDDDNNNIQIYLTYNIGSIIVNIVLFSYIIVGFHHNLPISFTITLSLIGILFDIVFNVYTIYNEISANLFYYKRHIYFLYSIFVMILYYSMN